MPELKPTVTTVCSPAAVYAALGLAWQAAFASPMPRTSGLVLLSQWALETGGGHACNNNNFAGIKHVSGDGRDWASYETTEVIGGKVVPMEQSFRAYDTLEEGAIDYLATLRHNFAPAWPAVESGDVAQFARLLSEARYYTAPEASYAAGLEARFAQMQAAVPLETPTDPAPAPTPDDELANAKLVCESESVLDTIAPQSKLDG